MTTTKISPTFAGDDYTVIMELVNKSRTETGIPTLSVSAAIMRLVRKELGK